MAEEKPHSDTPDSEAPAETNAAAPESAAAGTHADGAVKPPAETNGGAPGSVASQATGPEQSVADEIERALDGEADLPATQFQRRESESAADGGEIEPAGEEIEEATAVVVPPEPAAEPVEAPASTEGEDSQAGAPEVMPLPAPKLDTGKTNYTPLLIAAAIIVLVDQVTKITVLKNMDYGQSIPVIGDWLRLTYTENPGMAFGIELGAPALVTIFSIVATILIVVYLARVGRLYAPYRYSLSLVLGGAVGNIIDRVFYGAIWYDEPLFLGRVVDFIHVNLWRGHVPEAIPFIGGNYIALFPIWNVADMAIVTGVAGILIFQRSFHRAMAAMEVSASPVVAGTAPIDGVAPNDPLAPDSEAAPK
ncbi:MAG: signal peptidase II [Rhodothermales bacterium]|nr:signal peptidase II [Rhodothermales bacterium]MBO6781561.1 signal peptidase II [Rhodothermales bacterium]